MKTVAHGKKNWGMEHSRKLTHQEVKKKANGNMEVKMNMEQSSQLGKVQL
jgi:hypothetical protein